MSLTLLITPGGQLRIAHDPESVSDVSDEAEQALEKAFGESSAEGLLLLASRELAQELPVALVFWRSLARQFFQAVCQLGEEAFQKWQSVAAPSEAELALLAAEAPPMRGLEYLNAGLLQTLWNELRELGAARAAEFPEGPAAWLRSVNPLWHLLGRVTFHLAENKRDPQKPFAFLATYTHKLSGQARLQHLPLAEALKTYAGAKDQQKLESLLEPVRRAAERSPLAKELLDKKALFAPQAWTVREAYRFLTESPAIEAAGVVVRLPDWWSPRSHPRPQVQVRIGGRPPSAFGLDELLDFEVAVSLDGATLTADERRELLDGTEGLVLLRGKWVEVDQTKLKQALDHWKLVAQEHPNGIDFIAGMRLLSGADLSVKEAVDEEVDSWSRVTAGNWLRDTLERLRRPDNIDALRPGHDLNATLRPYQAEGVRWLWFMMELGLGACLADDMGLGKTIQIIDLLLQRKREAGCKSRGPSLLVVPASLIGNWRQELTRFAPSLAVFFAHRSETSVEILDRVAADPMRELATFDLVITTYGLVRRQDWLTKMKWSLAVLDEAQAIKNAGSAQTKSVKKLAAGRRIVLTGTPIENHLGDLWSLFDFCCPGLLGSAAQFKQFVKRLIKLQDSRAFGSLRRLVRPYILRRMKTDPAIVPDLPDKTEMRAECGLSRKQAALYERAVKELAQRLDAAKGMARRGLVLSTLMQLKQICNHPDQYLASTAYLPEQSGKFERLALLCEPIAERQEKALVFTQFQSLTQPLADYLATVFGRPGLVLHGGTPVRKRGELVRTFQHEAGPPFFVVSLKAGGSGLNLTAASHVIHFDRWWNPAVENQATDRAFRIGQKRNVLVHKFVCRGTVEERIDEMLTSKQAVADQLLSEEGETRLTELSNDELLRFVSLDIGRATAEE
ncbi:MAG TPA: DEAD/DEAH box helicase [Gemmataceae bacterium]|jgi:non-specific serine/threonine protein kinase